MPDGGELKAVFKGIQEPLAQAVEDAGKKAAELGDKTMQEATDSLDTVGNAEQANLDAVHGARDGLNTGDLGGEGGSGSSGGSAERRAELSRMLNGEGAADSGGEAGTAQGEEKKPLPDWLKKRWEDGEQFNRDNHSRYPHNEVELATKKRVDSYKPDEEIVERKNTQLSEVQERTAKGYIDSLREKYKPGQLIADTPKNRAEGLAGKELTGDHILEVPPQAKDIPQNVLDHATDHDVTIRDTNGKEYN